MKTLAFAVLAASVIMSAISVVYVKHESRKHFVTLQGLERSRDNLQVEWTRFQLEYSTYASHDRIEDVAATALGLYVPRPQSVVLVTR